MKEDSSNSRVLVRIKENSSYVCHGGSTRQLKKNSNPKQTLHCCCELVKRYEVC